MYEISPTKETISHKYNPNGENSMVRKEQITIRVKKLPPNRAARSKVITSANNKGGTAKTTEAMTLALHLVRMGYNVCLLDNDAQSNLSQRLGIGDADFKDKRTNVFFKQIDTDDFESNLMDFPIVIHYPYFYRPTTDKKLGTLSIVPGSQDAGIAANAAFETLLHDSFAREDSRDLHERYRVFIRHLKQYYDYIIIDTAPALTGNVLNQLAVSVADEIVIPIDGLEAAKGITNLLSWIRKEVMLHNTDGKVPGVLFAFLKYQEDTDDLKNIFNNESGFGIKNAVYRVMKTHFREFTCDRAVKELPKLKNNVYAGFGKKNVYDELCAEIIERINSPRPDIFESYGTHVSAFEWDLRTINRVSLNRTPQFLIPKFLNNEPVQNVINDVDTNA